MGLLTNDVRKVEIATGFDSWYQSLPAHLALDGFRSELPLCHIPDRGRATIFMKEIDRTNVEGSNGVDADIVFHSPYFTFDARLEPTDAVSDVLSAVAAHASSSDRLDARLPVGLHGELARATGARPSGGDRFALPAYRYSIRRSDVATAFRPGYLASLEPARHRISTLGVESSLEPYLGGDEDDALDPLDALLDEAGVDVALLSSPLNVQEVTGFPMALLQEGVWAVVARGAAEVHVLSRRELPWYSPAREPLTSDRVHALVADGTLGLEELDLSWAGAGAFGVDPAAAVPISDVLRRWRERRSWRDLPHYLLASDVTSRGVEAAMSLVRERLEGDGDVTELDAYRRYREVVEEIIRSESLPIRVTAYFTHTHAGARSLFPARATRFSLRDLTSLKMDAGLLVFDAAGLYRAVSDITRSVVGTERGRWFYELLDRALRQGVIKECRAGRTGEEVFRRGMGMLEGHRSGIVEAGFAPDWVSSLTEAFNRDVGHLLGKQEPATVSLRRGNGRTLEAGMVGAAEFQWPFRDHCIGVEDLFLVTQDEPVNLTRPP